MQKMVEIAKPIQVFGRLLSLLSLTYFLGIRALCCYLPPKSHGLCMCYLFIEQVRFYLSHSHDLLLLSDPSEFNFQVNARGSLVILTPITS